MADGGHGIGPRPLPADRQKLRYTWPDRRAFDASAWRRMPEGTHRMRAMPESRDELERDSRWLAFFPSPICTTTTSNGGISHVEKGGRRFDR
jgi:hypothetical protein